MSNKKKSLKPRPSEQTRIILEQIRSFEKKCEEHLREISELENTSDEVWLARVRDLLIRKYGMSTDLELDEKAWLDYKEAGFLPEEAIREDFSYV